MFNKIIYHSVLKDCSDAHAELVAVSKKRSVEELRDLYGEGQRVFGENRVQDLLEKKELLPEDIQWHLIGHLQTNKVKYIADFISFIHAVDSAKLLVEINKQAAANNRVIDCLLQFHIAQEESKYGIPVANIDAFLQSLDLENLKHINIKGVMGMASFVEDESQIKSEFKQLKSIYNQLKNKYFIDKDSFDTLSMGMSGDYQIALEEGSTMVRVGSLLFS